MAGRKPKPTALKILSGNPGKRPLPKGEPVPAGLLGGPPDWMSADQRESWDYAVSHAPRGLLRSLDRGVFATWVCAEAAHRKAAEALARHGLVRKTKAGDTVPSLYEGIMNRQAQIMLRAASELGFSPTSRAKIAIKADQQSENPWAKFRGA